MHFITMWKDYIDEVIKPSLCWLKHYWKEYFIFTLIQFVGMLFYYSYMLTRRL